MSESPQPSASQWIGKSVRRIEDEQLLTGRGRFTDDVALPGQAHAVFVRSPHAHARIAGIDIGAAAAAPGVLAVITGADVVADDAFQNDFRSDAVEIADGEGKSRFHLLSVSL